MEQEVPEEYKEALRKKFEIACQRGKWLYYGGKVVITVDKPKPGKRQTVDATIILQSITEI